MSLSFFLLIITNNDNLEENRGTILDHRPNKETNQSSFETIRNVQPRERRTSRAERQDGERTHLKFPCSGVDVVINEFALEFSRHLSKVIVIVHLD